LHWKTDSLPASLDLHVNKKKTKKNILNGTEITEMEQVLLSKKKLKIKKLTSYGKDGLRSVA